MKKALKHPIISGLFVSILAAALWENFISKFCTFVYINISSIIDRAIITFSNDTYKKISTGINNFSIVYIMFFIILSNYIAFFIAIKLFRGNNIPGIITKETAKKEYRKKFLFLIIISFICIFFIFICIYMIGNFIFINKCQTNSLCNLEIISPYVSDIEYKELKSTFYSIQTKEDYEVFTDTIKQIGERYSLNLRE